MICVCGHSQCLQAMMCHNFTKLRYYSCRSRITLSSSNCTSSTADGYVSRRGLTTATSVSYSAHSFIDKDSHMIMCLIGTCSNSVRHYYLYIIYNRKYFFINLIFICRLHFSIVYFKFINVIALFYRWSAR